MAAVIAFNTLVWLKQPGYPWWPGMVLDPTSIEMEIPTGCDTCVLCLPSTSSSVAFASATNANEIIRFMPAKDDLLIQEGKLHADCAAAIEEALLIHMQQEQQQQQSEYEESSKHLSNARQAPAHGRGERRRQKTEKSRRDESPKSRRRPQTKYRHERNDHEDAYEREALCEPRDGTQEADAAYLESVLRERRQPARDAALHSARLRLDALHAKSNLPLSDAAEDEVLDTLSPLTMISVTLDQLRGVRIGVSVGRFLSREYPARVVSLAAAILRFWFRQLPASTQQRLNVQTELEDASNDTTAGSENACVSLGALGMQLEDCFTDAEVDQTIHDPAAVARAIEEELAAANDEDIRIATLQAMRGAENGELRRALLAGRVTAQELVKHAVNPESFALLLNDGVAISDVTSPAGAELPLNPISAFENFTTLYACPSCGVREAVAHGYSVHAHDNMREILRCLKCGITWNSDG